MVAVLTSCCLFWPQWFYKLIAALPSDVLGGAEGSEQEEDEEEEQQPASDIVVVLFAKRFIHRARALRVPFVRAGAVNAVLELLLRHLHHRCSPQPSASAERPVQLTCQREADVLVQTLATVIATTSDLIDNYDTQAAGSRGGAGGEVISLLSGSPVVGTSKPVDTQKSCWRAGRDGGGGEEEDFGGKTVSAVRSRNIFRMMSMAPSRRERILMYVQLDEQEEGIQPADEASLEQRSSGVAASREHGQSASGSFRRVVNVDGARYGIKRKFRSASSRHRADHEATMEIVALRLVEVLEVLRLTVGVGPTRVEALVGSVPASRARGALGQAEHALRREEGFWRRK
eukprot:GHVS01106516.1.p1 GENE.GHVS01106516.1~~GHVS01106516.1.p1  ORF type:complete len:344 (+),score=80.72 GHVS01106516.1:1306-2337(+)